MSFLRTNNHKLIREIASDTCLTEAFNHVKKKRQNHPDNADIWHVCHHWQQIKTEIQHRLITSQYYFSPIKQYWHSERKETISLWSSEDAIVLKAMSITLSRYLKERFDLKDVRHIKGHGGVKKALQDVSQELHPQQQIFKTDIKSYYQSIDHEILLKQVKQMIPCMAVYRLIKQFCQHVTIYQGKYHHRSQTGILRGSSLSPVLGTIYLYPIDRYAQRRELKYFRYMDDLLFITTSKQKLACIIRGVCAMLKKLKLRLAKNKTYKGSAQTGFKWLGVPNTTHTKKTILSFMILTSSAFHTPYCYSTTINVDSNKITTTFQKIGSFIISPPKALPGDYPTTRAL